MQRDAIWKWRWLGFRNSTPGFKGSLVILGIGGLPPISRVPGVNNVSGRYS